MIRVPALGYE